MLRVYAAFQEGFERATVASDDTAQASLVDGLEIIPVQTLGQLIEHMYALYPVCAHPRRHIAGA